ncbi:hypothetical protein [Falsiroseomonas oryziterrae]|uniref:hypothetical protein n=1 Tax=Falsiroseomonas oryziterrae TaxID=2911368 RepID=UPI001F269932|nr:hypothetical protein [Roseomonas sp. NPKOSM-4]
MQSMVQHSAAVRAAIESLGGTIAVAAALVDGGRRIDLAGLERDCAVLCAAVMTLDMPEARRLRPALEDLLFRVNGLAARLDPPD